MTALVSGAFPTDFLLQAVIEQGLSWYRANGPVAGPAVFGHLTDPLLNAKYGAAKIAELTAFIQATNIPVVQHWSLVGQVLPCFSVQLMDGGEAENEAGLGDWAEQADQFDSNGNLLGRQGYVFSPVRETLHVGIHAATTPDYAKYLYYFLTYVLMVFKPILEQNGIDLSAYHATDISRLNEWLPQGVFTRFVNVTMRTTPEFLPQTADQIITAISGVQLNVAGGNIVPNDTVLPPG